jgi:hypothetical protein
MMSRRESPWPEDRQQQPGGSTALSSALPGIAFAVWLLDCYASSGSLDLSMHVGISPC